MKEIAQPVLPETRDLIRSLSGTTCPMCGKMKRPSQTMCPREYGRLPASLKKRLYNRIGEGYEAAVQTAMTFLGVDEFHLPAAEGSS